MKDTIDDNENRAIRIIEVRCEDREFLLITCEALEWIPRIPAVRVEVVYLLLDSFPKNSFTCLRHRVCGGGGPRNYLLKQRQLIHKSSIINMIDSTLNFLEMRAGWCSN